MGCGWDESRITGALDMVHWPHRRHPSLLWARRGNLKRETMSAQSWPMVFAIVLALPVAACSGLGVEDTKAGFSCVDDSPECVGQRQTALNALLTVVAHDRFDTDFEANAEAVAVTEELLEAEPVQDPSTL